MIIVDGLNEQHARAHTYTLLNQSLREMNILDKVKIKYIYKQDI